MWYQAIHSDIKESYPCLAAGFIHISSSVTVADAMEVVNITIRETIKYLSHVSNSPEIPNISGPSSGKVEVEYVYNANTQDNDGDNVSYLFDWGMVQIVVGLILCHLVPVLMLLTFGQKEVTIK